MPVPWISLKGVATALCIGSIVIGEVNISLVLYIFFQKVSQSYFQLMLFYILYRKEACIFSYMHGGWLDSQPQPPPHFHDVYKCKQTLVASTAFMMWLGSHLNLFVLSSEGCYFYKRQHTCE